MGGVTIAQVAERRPDAVDRLVHLSTFILPAGSTSRRGERYSRIEKRDATLE
ncbi:hypothetical protein MUK72_17250 (plasmid) [Halococcus dombrowskii]|uniref:Uncharacterized protein n=1 Tax=Halococcus dombrowskii TaxID=179637 RepID=A0AAX3ATD9_HALDO|nr:hypothetical protein [Halococcus dombrowskii]UOO96955.1 hypothetical protein MUK72_17250 [Halococcus dombrowskii]